MLLPLPNTLPILPCSLYGKLLFNFPNSKQIPLSLGPYISLWQQFAYCLHLISVGSEPQSSRIQVPSTLCSALLISARVHGKGTTI